MNPWSKAALAAARLTAAASFFPLGIALAYAATRRAALPTTILTGGGALFATGFLATLVLLAAGGRAAFREGRSSLPLLCVGVGNLLAQLALGVVIAGAWRP